MDSMKEVSWSHFRAEKLRLSGVECSAAHRMGRGGPSI